MAIFKGYDNNRGKTMNFFEMVKINIKNINKSCLVIAGSLFSMLSVVLSFVTWEELGIKRMFIKGILFGAILIISLIAGAFWVCILKKNNLVWSNGDGQINICYADIMKIAFPKASKGKKIVVIPVNTCFDTIVDENLAECDKPLVSPITVHGLWVKNMVKHGVNIEELDNLIDNYII